MRTLRTIHDWLAKVSGRIPGNLYVIRLQDSRVIFLCGRSAAFHGLPKGVNDKEGNICTLIFHPDDLHLIASLRDHLAGDPSVHSFVCRLKHRAGDHRWMFISSSVIASSSQGIPTYALMQGFELEGTFAPAGISRLLSERAFAKEHSGKLAVLTARERQLLQLIGRGYKNHEISKELSISVETVETHRKTIIRKLGAGSVVDLVRYADAMEAGE